MRHTFHDGDHASQIHFSQGLTVCCVTVIWERHNLRRICRRNCVYDLPNVTRTFARSRTQLLEWLSVSTVGTTRLMPQSHDARPHHVIQWYSSRKTAQHPSYDVTYAWVCFRVVRGLGWPMGWVGLGWVNYSKSTKNLKGFRAGFAEDILNIFWTACIWMT